MDEPTETLLGGLMYDEHGNQVDSDGNIITEKTEPETEENQEVEPLTDEEVETEINETEMSTEQTPPAEETKPVAEKPKKTVTKPVVALQPEKKDNDYTLLWIGGLLLLVVAGIYMWQNLNKKDEEITTDIEHENYDA